MELRSTDDQIVSKLDVATLVIRVFGDVKLPVER